jgi:hypothetical protein
MMDNASSAEAAAAYSYSSRVTSDDDARVARKEPSSRQTLRINIAID